MDWYVAFTNVQAEKRAEAGLLRKGFSTFLPMQARWIKRRGRRKAVEWPLFPRYLFVVGDLKKDWHVDGVQGLLSDGGGPLTVRESVIEALRTATVALEPDVGNPYTIAAGARVRFMDGPFEGIAGVCKSALSENKVEISIELLKREVAVRISSCHLAILA